jgi:hypothetical protein
VLSPDAVCSVAGSFIVEMSTAGSAFSMFLSLFQGNIRAKPWGPVIAWAILGVEQDILGSSDPSTK